MSDLKVEQRFVISYLRRKKLKMIPILEELQAVYGEDSLKEDDVKYWIHELKLGRTMLTDDYHPGRPLLDDVDARILRRLAREPYSSMRSLSDSLKLPVATVHRHLTKSLNMKNRHFKWVPHLLTEDLKAKRSTEAGKLLKILRREQANGWNGIITGDESWIYLSNQPGGVWLEADSPLPEVVRRTIDSEKHMLCVFWGIAGIAHHCWLPSGSSFDASFFAEEVLQPVADELDTTNKTRHQRLMLVHFDNAKPHTAKATTERMKQLRMKRTPQPPYSPDIAPSDFFLFGWLKEQLTHHQIADEDGLFEAVDEILGTLSVETIRSVFHEWIRRLERVIEAEGDYIE